MPHVERLRAVAQARSGIAFGAGAHPRVGLEDLKRLVPVARAHAPDGGEAAGGVGRHRRVGVGEGVQSVADRPGESAMARREPARAGERGQSKHREQHRARAPARRLRRRAPGGEESDRESREAEHEQHGGHEHPKTVPRGRARAERHAVAAERVRREDPCDHGAGARRAGYQQRDAAQSQRHDQEPQRHAQRERHEGAARVGEQERQEHQAHRGIGERAE